MISSLILFVISPRLFVVINIWQHRLLQTYSPADIRRYHRGGVTTVLPQHYSRLYKWACGPGCGVTTTDSIGLEGSLVRRAEHTRSLTAGSGRGRLGSARLGGGGGSVLVRGFETISRKINSRKSLFVIKYSLLLLLYSVDSWLCL